MKKIAFWFLTCSVLMQGMNKTAQGMYRDSEALDQATQNYIKKKQEEKTSLLAASSCARDLLYGATLHHLNHQWERPSNQLSALAVTIKGLMAKCPGDLDYQARNAARVVTRQEEHEAVACKQEYRGLWLNNAGECEGCQVLKARVEVADILYSKPFLWSLSLFPGRYKQKLIGADLREE